MISRAVIILFCLLTLLRSSVQSSVEGQGRTNQGTRLNQYYLGYFGDETILVSLYISSPVQNVTYSMQAPGVGLSTNGTVPDNNHHVDIRGDVIVSSINDQNKGIYLTTEPDVVDVFGFYYYSSKACSYRLIPRARLATQEYTYYSMSVSTPSSNIGQYNSSILIVGTENGTEMELTVTQQVEVNINGPTTLLPNTQYSFVINRFQTVYITSSDDLTGSKIVTDNPVSVFSGHEQEFNISQQYCSAEQIPPTVLWDTVHYVTSIANDQSYDIRILAADDSIDIDIYCDNTKESHVIDEGESVIKTLGSSVQCAILSDKKVLVTQFGKGNDDVDTLMIVMPGTAHYSDHLEFSHNNFINFNAPTYFNLIVLAEYFQPQNIRMIAKTINKTLGDEEWTPIKVNDANVAYTWTYSTFAFLADITVVHTNPDALMMATVYAYSESEFGHGHAAGFNVQKFLVSCPSLTAPDNGVVQCSGSDVGAICVFACDDGFELSGSSSRTCQDDGTWSGTETMCSAERSCPSLTAPDNGMIECSGSGVGDICVFTCDVDYELIGSSSRTCQDDGTWSGTESMCLTVCPMLGEPDNGEISCSDGEDEIATEGDTCIYVCDEGFIVSGESVVRECQSDGTWSGSEPTCERLPCVPLEAPDNGDIECSGFLFEDTCNFTCDDGFELSGSSTRTCQSDANWSGTEAMCVQARAVTCGNTIQSVNIRVRVNGRNAVVRFSAVPDHPEVMYLCKLNGGRYKPCTSPLTYSNLRTRSHRVTVRAVCPG